MPKTVSIFIDENLKENLIGGLCIHDAHKLLCALHGLRDRFCNYDEIRYSKTSWFNIPFYKAIIDMMICYNFSYYVLRSDSTLDLGSYKNLVDTVTTDHKQSCVVFLDYFSNQRHDSYIEELLYTNSSVQYASRQDSKSHILIQLTDLLLALYTRDENMIQSAPKRELISYFRATKLSQKLHQISYTKKGQTTPSKTVGLPVNNDIIHKIEKKSREFTDKDALIYVAGHRGLVGSAIIRQLQSIGYSNLITRTHTELDLTNREAVEDFFTKEQPEYVFLAAAKVGGIMANNTYPADFLYQNLQMQNNVIHAAYLNGVRKLLFLGSSCIYPKNCPQPIQESYLLTGPLEPTNEPYAIAKIAGIKMCQSYNRQYNTNFIACMPTNLYGPGDNFDLQTSHVLPALIRKFHEAKISGADEVMCRGDGSPMREFLYVDDMADGCIHLMKTFDPTKEQNEKGDIFVNMGTGTDITIKDLALLIKKTIGYTGNIVWDTEKPNGTMKKVLDVSAIKKIGWKAETKFEEGIKKTYEWFLQNN